MSTSWDEGTDPGAECVRGAFPVGCDAFDLTCPISGGWFEP